MIKKVCSIFLAVLLVFQCVTAVIPTVSSASAKTPLKITSQPVSVVVKSGATAKVSFSAKGDGLKYTWYFKNSGAKKFVKTTAFKGKTYSLKMNSSRKGRQVYCVVKDKYGKSVKTKTVTLYMGTPLKITTQPKSVSVKNGATAKVSFLVKGDGLKYTWYYKNYGASKFVKTTAFKGKTYSIKMNTSRGGRQVYCVIKDKYGKSVKTNAVTLSIKLSTINAGIYSFCNLKTGTYLSASNNTLKLSKTAKNWNLKSSGENDFYVYSNGSDLLLDIHNAYIAEGTTVKLWQKTGYNVQRWKIAKNPNGTYSFISAANNKYCLGFKNGKAVLQKRSKANKAQEWKAANNTTKFYRSVLSKGKIIELQLPLNITKVISTSRLQKWANDLETAYYSFYDLTNYKPYKNIVVEAYKPCKYIGYVIDGSNIIHIDNEFIYDDLKKMSARKNDWNFCALHEMGHMFDYGRSWNFEAEVMTDFKLAYVLEKNGAEAAPSEFGASTTFKGKEIINAYKTLGSGFSKQYNIFGLAERFLKIKNDIGWSPIKKTFHYMQKNNKTYVGLSNAKRFEKFISLLSSYSGKNVKSYFTTSEWNTIIRELQK